MNIYKIINILEQDFGCEGLPDGQEYCVDIILEDSSTNEKITISAPDAELYKKNITIGSFIKYDGNIIEKYK